MHHESGTIEHFLIVKKDARTDTLIYFDSNGKVYEKPVDPAIAAEAFRIFDGKPRCALRSSGGLALVQPTQVVISHGPKGPEFRVKVQFRDLKPGTEARPEYITHTKILSPRELMPAFDHVLHHKQRFVVDLGKGLVPVHLFHVTEDEAFFVDAEEWTRIVSSKTGRRAELQTFRVALDQVRLAHGTDSRNGRAIYDLAELNLARLKQADETVFPKGLRFAGPVTVPTGCRPEELRSSLKKACQQGGSDKVLRIELRRDSTGELIPFGLFE